MELKTKLNLDDIQDAVLQQDIDMKGPIKRSKKPHQLGKKKFTDPKNWKKQRGILSDASAANRESADRAANKHKMTTKIDVDIKMAKKRKKK